MTAMTLTKKMRMALLAAACLTATRAAFFASAARAADCSEIQVRSVVEVRDSGVSLADLLAESCPRFRRAAATVWLANSPPSGGQRIFAGSEIRQAIERLLPIGDSAIVNAFVPEHVPERIVVRRSGAKASCSDIEAFIVRALGERNQTDTSLRSSRNSSLGSSFHLDCGRSGRIPRDAPLELLKVFWDPALETWEYSLRCVRARDCVPFLVRQVAQQTAGRTNSTVDDSGAAPISGFVARPRLAHQIEAPSTVRVGQTATLYWEQDGIRAVVPVICLDHGAVGKLIRARIKNGNRVLRAEVVSAGILRAAL